MINTLLIFLGAGFGGVFRYLKNEAKIRGVSVFRAVSGFGETGDYDELIKPISNRKMSITQQVNFYDDVKNLFEYWKEKGLPLC